MNPGCQGRSEITFCRRCCTDLSIFTRVQMAKEAGYFAWINPRTRKPWRDE